jgi:hypothetical protein
MRGTTTAKLNYSVTLSIFGARPVPAAIVINDYSWPKAFSDGLVLHFSKTLLGTVTLLG